MDQAADDRPADDRGSGPGGYRLEDQIGFKLRIAQQKHLEIFAARLPEVTPTQLAVLAKLAETGPLSQNALGRRVALDAATTKGVVDRLRRKGFVEGQSSETDARRLTISLTPEGARFTERAVEVATRISAETVGNLSAREAARLKLLLDKL